MTKPLTARQARFVELFLVSLNATEAYRESYGTGARVSEANGARLLRNARVRDAISAAKKARSERVEITADDVVRQLVLLAHADPNELVEYRRTCCRYCHGDEFGYQETEREQATRRAEREAAWAKRKNAKPTDVFEFDELGGVGYDGRKPPVDDCPTCHGLGVERAVVKDTRHLSPAARRLYAGVKVTKDGIEVKMHDQQAALFKLLDHLKPQTPKDGGISPEDTARMVREHLLLMAQADGLRA